MQSRPSVPLPINVARTRFAYLNPDRIPSPVPTPPFTPSPLSTSPASEVESPYLSAIDMSSELSPNSNINPAVSASPDGASVGNASPHQSPPRPASVAPALVPEQSFGVSSAPSVSSNIASAAVSYNAAPRSNSSKVQAPTFSGDVDEDAEGWLVSLRSAAHLNGINESSTNFIDYFRLALTGVAARWFYSLSPDYDQDRQTMTSIARRTNPGQELTAEQLQQIDLQARPPVLRDFTILREKFLERFAPAISTNAAELRLMSINISEFKSVSKLYQEMELLWCKCKPAPPEQVKIKEFVKAMVPWQGYATTITQQNPKTVIQAYHIAFARENGEALESGANRSMRSTSYSRSSYRSNSGRDYYNSGPSSASRGSSGYRSSSVNTVDQEDFVTRREFTLSMNRVRDEIGGLSLKLDQLLQAQSTDSSRGDGSAPRSTSRKCYSCGKLGHIANECPNPRNNDSNRNRANDRRDRRGNSNAVDHDDQNDDERESTQDHEDQDQDYYPSDQDDDEKHSFHVINVECETECPEPAAAADGSMTNAVPDDHTADSVQVINVAVEPPAESPKSEGINTVSNRSSAAQLKSETKAPKSTHPVCGPLLAQGLLADEVEVDAIVDTGAGLTLMASKVFERLPEKVRSRLEPAEKGCYLTGATGHPLTKRGVIQLPLEIDGVKMDRLRFIVIDNLTNDILVGNDHLSNGDLFGNINAAKGTVQYVGNGKSQVFRAQTLSASTRKRRQVEKESKAPERKMKPENPNHVIGSVRLLKDAVIPPRSELTIPAAETKVRGVGHFRDSYIKPRQTRLGAKYKHPIIVVERYPSLKANIKIVHSICDVSDQMLDGATGIPVQLANPTNQSITLRKGTRVAMAEAVDQAQVGSTNSVFPTGHTDPVHSSH